MVFRREPVVVQTLVLAALNALVIFGVVSLDAEELGALNTLVAAVLGFVTRRLVTPLAGPRDRSGEALRVRDAAVH